jgi:hypothetical protein
MPGWRICNANPTASSATARPVRRARIKPAPCRSSGGCWAWGTNVPAGKRRTLGNRRCCGGTRGRVSSDAVTFPGLPTLYFGCSVRMARLSASNASCRLAQWVILTCATFGHHGLRPWAARAAKTGTGFQHIAIVRDDTPDEGPRFHPAVARRNTAPSVVRRVPVCRSLGPAERWRYVLLPDRPSSGWCRSSGIRLGWTVVGSGRTRRRCSGVSRWPSGA